MITLTIVEEVKVGKQLNYDRHMELFHSTDKARKRIIPIVKEMQLAKAQNRTPKIRIDGVSYDSNSEKLLLLELKAITSIENEDDNGY